MQPRVFCLPWLRAVCRLPVRIRLSAACEGTVPGSPALPWVRGGSVASPSQAYHSRAQQIPLGQVWSFASGPANFVFRNFWAKWRKKKLAYHLKERRLLFFAGLETKCRGCFPAALLTSPWEGHAQCPHHSPPILGRCGQALGPHAEVRGVQ